MSTTRQLVEDYVAAVSTGDFDRLRSLVHPDATFGGTVMTETEGVDAFVQGFRNLRPVTVRTDVRDLVVDGDHASVLYDFVTDTPVGAVLCAEFLTVDQDRIRASTLLFDWRRWPEVIDAIRSRTSGSSRPAWTRRGGGGCGYRGFRRSERQVRAAVMAFDEPLAERIRHLIGDEPDTTERRLFGGLAFFLEGNMAVVVSSQGGIMIRVDPVEADQLVARSVAVRAEMRGRPMRGWLRIGAEHLTTRRQLARWVDRATTFTRALPAKP